MKSFKNFAAGLLALTVAGAATAQTPVLISGSTAFRKSAVTAIEHILQTGYVWGGVGSASTGTSQLIFEGNLISTGAAVIIETSWTGSEGGIYNLTHSTPPGNAIFINPASVTGLLTTGGATLSSSVLNASASSADIALADTFQASSLYKSPSLADNVIGVIPFLWIGANTNDAGITGVTHQQIKAALANLAKYALWSGTNNPSPSIDQDAVHVIGRDEDSGTRVVAFVESTYGAQTAPVQWAPIGTAGNYTGTTFYPANTVNGVTYPAGHSGYSSGGTLEGILADLTITADADIIGYLGLSDAKTGLAVASPTLTPLTWEGVQFWNSSTKTSNDSLIFLGQYTFWSYEHLFVRPVPASPSSSQVATDIVADLVTNSLTVADAKVSGYHVNQLSVVRATDGSPVYYP